MRNCLEVQGVPPIVAGKVKILIVEDQMPVAMMMTYLLASAGCETKVAATGKKAMQMAEAKQFDLITLEVDLPDTNGFELCCQLKENPRSFDTPVVFVSWRDCLEDQQQGLEFGAADYITKPFDATEFVSRILFHVQNQSDSGLMAILENQTA